MATSWEGLVNNRPRTAPGQGVLDLKQVEAREATLCGAEAHSLVLGEGLDRHAARAGLAHAPVDPTWIVCGLKLGPTSGF